MSDNQYNPFAGQQVALFTRHEMHPKPAVQANYFQKCSGRQLFQNEAHFEDSIMHDPEAIKVFSTMLGIDFAAFARQVRTGHSLRQYADIVARANDNRGSLIVVELMLGALNSDHIHRGLGYAKALCSKDVILVAESFPQSSLNLLAALRESNDRLGITVHLVKLECLKLNNGKGAYHLRPMTPPRTIESRETFLEALIRQVTSNGDDSLINCTVQDGKRLESNQGLGNLARIRIYSGHDNARLSLVALTPRVKTKLLRKHLPERLHSAIKQFDPITNSGHGKITVASFRFQTNMNSTAAADISIARIAGAYAEARKLLMADIGDFTRAPTSRAPRVPFLRLPYNPVALRTDAAHK